MISNGDKRNKYNKTEWLTRDGWGLGLFPLDCEVGIFAFSRKVIFELRPKVVLEMVLGRDRSNAQKTLNLSC